MLNSTIRTVNNNSFLLFIMYVPSQQVQGQLQTRHSADIGNYIMDRHNIKSRINYKKVLEKKHKKDRSKQANKQAR
jgi:hypothetical protein